MYWKSLFLLPLFFFYRFVVAYLLFANSTNSNNYNNDHDNNDNNNMDDTDSSYIMAATYVTTTCTISFSLPLLLARVLLYFVPMIGEGGFGSLMLVLLAACSFSLSME